MHGSRGRHRGHSRRQSFTRATNRSLLLESDGNHPLQLLRTSSGTYQGSVLHDLATVHHIHSAVPNRIHWRAALLLLGPVSLPRNGQMEPFDAEPIQFHLFVLLLCLDHEHRISSNVSADVPSHVRSTSEDSSWREAESQVTSGGPGRFVVVLEPLRKPEIIRFDLLSHNNSHISSSLCH